MDLENKIAIVTGSTSGIGAGTAKIFAGEGAKVVVTGRSEERGRKVVEEIASAGGTAVFFKADMANLSEVEALFRFTADTYGGLDILVNNHAPLAESLDESRDKPLLDVSLENWDSLLQVGLTSIFYTIRNALPLMIKNGGGSIINISSLASLQGPPGLSVYAASKGGMNAMTRQIAADYGKQNIRVNTIVVGTIICNDRMEMAWGDPRLRAATLETICVNRLGEAADIAHAAVYLASDKAGFVSGIELVVDGGQFSKVALPILDAWEQDEK